MALRPLALRPHLSRPHRAAFPAALYVILAAADLVFSLVAFAHGIAEGNPFMAWLLEEGWFISGKIAISLAVAGLMLVVYGRSKRWGWVVWGGVAVMGAVVLFHLWALPPLVMGRSLVAVAP